MSNTHRRCKPGFRPSRLRQALHGMLLASALGVSVAAHAEESHGNTGRKSYHIAGGSLGHALRRFASDAGILFTAESRLTDGKTSQGLQGEYTVEEGFRKLLAGSGLGYVFKDDRSVTLKVAESQPGAGSSTLPAVTVRGQAEYDSTDPYNTNYSIRNSTTATKTDAPIMETPVSIRVVPKALMDDQQAFDVSQAVRNVSGVQFSPVTAGYENFVIRGFDASGSIYVNGLRQTAFAEEVANLQRIEVIKGPAAVLYGRIEPGGLVNLVTSRPLDQPYYSLQQQFGSYDFYRTTVDATGPILEDQSLAYRFNLAYRNNQSFRDFNNYERIFLAPSLTWRISDSTQAHLLFEYQRDDFLADYGFPVIGNRPANFPVNLFLGDPAGFDYQDSQRVYFDWSHAFNEDWKLTNRFMTTLADYRQREIFPFDQPADNRVYKRIVWDVFQNRDSYSTNLDLTGHFNTWGAAHNVLIGLDYSRFEQSVSGHCCNAVPSIDVLNPVYGNIDPAFLATFPENFHTVNFQEWVGVYFQDQIELWDKLHILGGGRYDWATFGSGYSAESVVAADQSRRNLEIPSQRFSPRIGLVYQPWNWLSLYGNYTESLGASNGRTSNNRPLPPQIAEQYEVGFKTEFFEGRLSSTVALYNITKQNIATPDLSTPDLTDSIAIGEARSRGVEFDLAGQLSENWNISATYAYTDTDVTHDNAGNLGHSLPNAARNSGSLWTKYNFDSGALDGFSLGTGVFIVGKRQGNIQNDFQLPGYVRWDVSAAYQYDLGKSRLTAQVNIRNLLDKRFFPGADTFSGSTRFR